MGAVLLALIQVLEALWLIAALNGVGIAAQAGTPAELLKLGATGESVIMVVVLIRILAALALFTRHRAAWVMVMLITGAGLTVSLAGYALGRSDDVRLLLDVVAAFYLNQPGVRAVFGVHTGSAR
jgi:hypothetical protein